MPALRYVVLHHTGIEQPHFDLMLEMSAGLELSTWRLPHWPPHPDDQCTPLPKHRRDYLEYEGPVSRNRGQVKRVAAGNYRVTRNSPTHVAIICEDGTAIELALPFCP
jgi:hypothetical protein